MTDKMQALCDLLARVEAGTIFAGDFVTDEEAALVYDAFPPNDDDVVGSAEWAGLAYDGSLDAAKALHEAVLPGWLWFVGHLDGVELGFVCTVSNEPFTNAISFRGFSNSPARAWLICILRALIAQAAP